MEIVVDPPVRAKVRSLIFPYIFFLIDKSQSEGVSASIHAPPKAKAAKASSKTKTLQQMTITKTKKVSINFANILLLISVIVWS